jgi:hypothetical protein
MNRIRRVSMTVAHREVSLTVTHTTETTHIPRAKGIPGESELNEEHAPDLCPICGGSWLADFSTAVKEACISLDRLQAAVIDNQIHLRQQADGIVRICNRSFQQLKESS